MPRKKTIHQMIRPQTSSTRRRNRIGSEVVRRSSDKCLNCFFFNVIFYIILDQRNLIFLFAMDLCMLYDEILF